VDRETRLALDALDTQVAQIERRFELAAAHRRARITEVVADTVARCLGTGAKK
jgi:hypothetical protein